MSATTSRCAFAAAGALARRVHARQRRGERARSCTSRLTPSTLDEVSGTLRDARWRSSSTFAGTPVAPVAFERQRHAGHGRAGRGEHADRRRDVVADGARGHRRRRCGRARGSGRRRARWTRTASVTRRAERARIDLARRRVAHARVDVQHDRGLPVRVVALPGVPDRVGDLLLHARPRRSGPRGCAARRSRSRARGRRPSSTGTRSAGRCRSVCDVPATTSAVVAEPARAVAVVLVVADAGRAAGVLPAAHARVVRVRGLGGERGARERGAASTTAASRTRRRRADRIARVCTVTGRSRGGSLARCDRLRGGTSYGCEQSMCPSSHAPSDVVTASRLSRPRTVCTHAQRDTRGVPKDATDTRL